MAEIPRDLLFSRRWTAASKLDLAVDAIATWDPGLDRDVRLLVPIDVQALRVLPGSDEKMLRLVSPLNDPSGQGPGFPKPFDDGAVRPAGVHLHWAMPDSLLRGKLGEGAQRNQLGLAPLPDRWVVLRILTPAGQATVSVRGFVIEADSARVFPLDGYPNNATAATTLGAPITREQLTGVVGGSPTWASTYDSVAGRFGLHDPLDDLDTVAPQGIEGNSATYVVAGWWSDPTLDPLDGARGRSSMDSLLRSLGWTATPQWQDAGADQRQRAVQANLRKTAGLAPLAVRTADPPPSIGGTPIVSGFSTPLSKTFVVDKQRALTAIKWWPHASLLHGSVYGVPIGTATESSNLDNRPDPSQVRVALGAHDDDVISALVSTVVAGSGDNERRDTERLLAAFTGQLLRELDTPDGAVAVEEHEHRAAFGSFPGGTLGSDRLLSGQSRTRRTTGRQARRAGNSAKQSPTLAAQQHAEQHVRAKTTKLFRDRRTLLDANLINQVISTSDSAVDNDTAISTEPRQVARQAPRYHFPLDPLVAVQGVRRSLRHGNDARFSSDGLMWCRWAWQTQREWKGLVHGRDVLPTLGNGAIPDEILWLAQEAAVSSPYHRAWLAGVGARRSGFPTGVVRRRFDAEMALRYGKNAVYDGRTEVFADMAPTAQQRTEVLDQVLNHSMLIGVEPCPIGVTLWSQPWVPQWIEWEATIDTANTLDGWALDSVDLAGSAATVATDRLVGRTLLTVGATRTLASAVTDFLAAEDQLEIDTGGLGEVDDTTETALASLAVGVHRLDLLTATLDGLRLAWLGLDATIDGVQRIRSADGTLQVPAPIRAPLPLASGAITLTRLRLVDTFGRTLDLGVPMQQAAVATRNDRPGSPATLELPPRLPRPARWMFRLVDAATPAGVVGDEAFVDQVDPASQVSPVAGFLLPDHLDESLELFDANGDPIGELFHAAISGQVVWEIAPGRAGSPDSGPLHELPPAHQPIGLLGTGLLSSDVKSRATSPAPVETALSAALRAIDTTLWTVDTMASFGTEHIAGLVGRPIAVVRAQLWLDLQPETGLDLSDPARAAERAMAEQTLAAVPFPVRLGELTRLDDGLLGFFVDDDFERFYVVDQTVKQMAKPRGPSGQNSEAEPIEHPYLVAEDTLLMHYGQRVTLTLLMHAGSKVHLTSGVLPRKSLELARDWVAPGLARIAPSLRTGPLLIDPDLVRLPKPTMFGPKQRFTRRNSPTTWKDDPILAATQTALLPDGATSVQDGYIRVMPDDTEDAP